MTSEIIREEAISGFEKVVNRLASLEQNDYFRPIRKKGTIANPLSNPPSQLQLNNLLGTVESYHMNVVGILESTGGTIKWGLFGDFVTNTWHVIRLDPIPGDNLFLSNDNKLIMERVGGGEGGRLTMNTSDDVLIANLVPSRSVILGAMNSTTTLQLYVNFKEYGTTNRGVLQFNQSSVILAPGDLDIIATGAGADVKITPGGGLFLYNVPTSDPGVVGQVWRDGTTLKISI